MSRRRFHTERTALIDADHLAYQQAAAAHSNQSDGNEMAERISALLEAYTRLACCTEFITVFSCDREDNFRREVYAPYKTNRTAEPPAMLELAQQLLRDAGPTINRPHIEADDIMGIAQTGGKVLNPVIVSVDKDMRSIPGLHFNPDKDDFPVYITELQADHSFFMQWLTGDATDGYPGIKGIGPAKAIKILDRADNNMAPVVGWSDVVLAAYRDAGKTLEEALQQARCARILRNEDWNAEDKCPILWGPPILNPAEIWETEVA